MSFVDLQELNVDLQIVSVYDLGTADEDDWDGAVHRMQEDYGIESLELTWLTVHDEKQDSEGHKVFVAPVGISERFRLTAFNRSG